MSARLIFWIGLLIAIRQPSLSETNNHALLNNSLNGVADLSAIESHWATAPNQYYAAAKDLFVSMRRNSKDIVTISNVDDFFASFINKTDPSTGKVASTCLELKSGAILEALNIEHLSDNPDTWSLIAKYIKWLRSSIKPGYINRGYLNPPGASNRDPEKVRLALQENELNKESDHFQTLVRTTDRKLTLVLLHHLRTLKPGAPLQRDYKANIATTAKLTAEEKKQIN